MNKLWFKNRTSQPGMRLFRLSALFVSFFLLFGLLGFAIVSTYDQTIQKDKQLASLQQEVNKEQEKNKSLIAQKEYYKSDTFIEKEARNTLGLSYPNEETYVFKQKVQFTPESSSQNVQKSVEPSNQKSNLDKWLDIIFGS